MGYLSFADVDADAGAPAYRFTICLSGRKTAPIRGTYPPAGPGCQNGVLIHRKEHRSALVRGPIPTPRDRRDFHGAGVASQVRATEGMSVVGTVSAIITWPAQEKPRGGGASAQGRQITGGPPPDWARLSTLQGNHSANRMIGLGQIRTTVFSDQIGRDYLTVRLKLRLVWYAVDCTVTISG